MTVPHVAGTATSIDTAPENLWRLRSFVTAFADLLSAAPVEETILYVGGGLLRQLVAHDDWLPDEFARPHPQHYQQYLLHADSAQRFSIVSFVWGPGQRTPIHDHTVWGLIGMLRGAEHAQSYSLARGTPEKVGAPVLLQPGAVEAVSPNSQELHDVHQVSNAFDDRVSISIHVYGANIGAVRRSVYQPDGQRKLFVSGYSNATLPNIWDISVSSQ